MTLSASLYQHANYGGRSASMHLRYHREFGGVPTYGQLTKSAFKAYDMHDRTSSIKMTATTADNDYGRLILFQNARYKGRYASFQALSGQTTEAAKLSDIDFNDRTSSALLVRHFTQECPPIPASILLDSIVADMDINYRGYTFSQPNLSGQNVHRTSYFAVDGDPVYSWDMWPSFNSSRMYIYLRIPIEAKLDSWFNYSCEARFWIYMYIDGNGTLRGYVDWYGAWVEGGHYTDFLLDKLMTATAYRILGSFGPFTLDFNNRISDALSAWEPINFQRLYYLPGRGGRGHVNDGVRLVLVTEV